MPAYFHWFPFLEEGSGTTVVHESNLAGVGITPSGVTDHLNMQLRQAVCVWDHGGSSCQGSEVGTGTSCFYHEHAGRVGATAQQARPHLARSFA